MFTTPEQLTLSLYNYKITGTTYLRLWDGDEGTIEMKPVFIDKEPENWFNILNDNGFGCEKILGARLEIYANYGPGYLSYLGDILVGQFKGED